jgi:hypothetical protein
MELPATGVLAAGIVEVGDVALCGGELHAPISKAPDAAMSTSLNGDMAFSL